MRRTSVLMTMVILIVALMLLAEPAQAQYYYAVWTDRYTYLFGDTVPIHYETTVRLPYGSRLWIDNTDTGSWKWVRLAPVRAGSYVVYCSTFCKKYLGTYIVSFRAYVRPSVLSSNVARTEFTVSDILYYENLTDTEETVTETYTGTEETWTEETIMFFETGEQSTMTTTLITTAIPTTTAVVPSTVETQTADMTSLMSTAIVAVVAGLAVGLVIGRRSKAKGKSGN